MTRGHWGIVLTWVGLPILMFLFLNFMSPGYMRILFDPTTVIGYDYANTFVALTGLEIVILTIAFAIYTTRREKRKVKNDETGEKQKMPCAMSATLFLTLLLCTIPNLGIVILGPAAVRVAEEVLLNPPPF